MSVVTEGAVLGHTGQQPVGLATGFNTVAWMRKLGPTLTKCLPITWETVNAAQAHENDLTGRCVSASRLASKAERLAGKIPKMLGDGLVMQRASLNLAADMAGVGREYDYSLTVYALGTNSRSDSDEFNFFKERHDNGARATAHARDHRFDADKASRP
jgi:enoyl-CoA hydratase/carnithine racemase